MDSIPFEITREDLLRSKTVSPGWYPLIIRSVEKGEAKTDGSMKVDAKFIILADGPFKDVPISRTFSEKAPGFTVSFIEAVSKRKIDPEKGGKFDLAMSQGKKVWGYVKNELYQNRLVNHVEDFRPYEEGQTQPTM
jgi:hypothetical protein